MDPSIFFAQLYGGLFIILGSLSLGSNFLGKTIQRTEKEMFTISTGYISLLLGLVTVILHNTWTMDWRIVITILGWATLLKGIAKTGFPGLIHRQAQYFKNHLAIESVFLVVLGLWLLWMGFSQ